MNNKKTRIVKAKAFPKFIEALDAMYPQWITSLDLAKLADISLSTASSYLSSGLHAGNVERDGIKHWRATCPEVAKKYPTLKCFKSPADQADCAERPPELISGSSTPVESLQNVPSIGDIDWLMVAQNVFATATKILTEDYPRAVIAKDREAGLKAELDAAKIRLDAVHALDNKCKQLQTEMETWRVRAESAEETIHDRDATIANLTDDLLYMKRQYGDPRIVFGNRRR